MPQVEHTTDDPHPLIDVDSDHISTVPSDYNSQYIKTDTQETRLEQESEVAERRAEQAKQKAEQKARQAKSKGNELLGQAKANSSNPVVIGNVVVIGALAAVFGSRAYQRYQREGFGWEFFGLTAGIAVAFGAADYFVSRYVGCRGKGRPETSC